MNQFDKGCFKFKSIIKNIKLKTSLQTMPVSYLDQLKEKYISSRLILTGFVFMLIMHMTKRTLICYNCVEIQILNIVPDSTVIESLTSYTFSFERSNLSPNVPQGSYMEIAFPQQYANRITFLQSPNISCSSEDLNSPLMYCSYSGNLLRVWNGFAVMSGAKRFQLKVSGIRNPFPAREYGPFSVKIYLSDGTLFDDQTASPSPVITTAGQSICSISSSVNSRVNGRGSIVISYQSNYISITNSSYKMLISMDTSYKDNPLSTLINPQIVGYSTLGNIGRYTFQINYTTTINISMLFPPSTKTVDKFIFIESFIDGLGTIDQCSVDIVNVSPNALITELSSTNWEVQKQAMYSFSLTPSTPIFPDDSLIIEFPTLYDLSKVTSAVFFLGIFGTKSLTKSNNIITIPELVYTYIQSRTIRFNISAIINPFDSRPVQLKLRTVTNEGFVRDLSTFALRISPGNFITNNFVCNTYQIGYKTACRINFTLSNSIKTDTQIRLIFPQSGWMMSLSGSNTQCQAQSTSSQLKSLFQCRYYNNKTFVLSKFTDWTNLSSIGPFSVVVRMEQSSIEIDHRIQLPWTVGNFVFSVGSYSNDNFAIDEGSYTFTTIKREIFESDGNGVSFERSETMTASRVYVGYNLPYDKGVSYNMRVYLPLQMTISQASILSSYGSLISYDSAQSFLNLRLTDTTAITRNVTITGFKSYSSTKPIVYMVQFLYQGTVYFHFSSTVSIPNPKQVETILVSMGSQIVYAINSVTLTLSELSAGDVITYSTSGYQNYLSTGESSSCSSAIVTCNLDGSMSVVSVNNADSALRLTRFTFVVRNPPFVGRPLFQLIVQDSTRNFLKQKSTFTLDVSQMNIIPDNFISYTSSNPYFRQQTTLTISFTLQVPGASRIAISLPTTYTFFSSKCTKNCMSSSFDTGNNSFYAMTSGNDIIVQFLVTNPNDFSEFIGITSKDSFQRNMDFGRVRLETICTNPCRSCSVDDKVLCISCYNFSTNKALSNGKCLAKCPDGEYQVTQSSLFYCRTCPQSCLTCTSATECQRCKPSFIQFNSSCLTTCPERHYAAIDQPSNTAQCQPCFSACLQCSTTPTYCSRCAQGFVLYENACITNCPTDWFSINRQCVQCPNNCALCQNQTAACLQCKNNFYLFQGNCFVNCPVAGFAKNISSGKCESCPSTCNVCRQFVTQCQQCKSGFFLFNGTCLVNCSVNEGYFSNALTQKCEICQSPCKRCSTLATYCLSCIAGRYQYNFQCYERCPEGTYASLSDSNPQCIACQWPCVRCSDNQSCSSCSTPFALNGSICVSSCGPTNFVNSQNQCEICPQKCKTCNITGCIQCSSSSEYLYGQNCVSSCAPLYKNDQSMVCQTCRNPCESCNTNSTTCSSCIDDYSLMAHQNSCYKVCPPTYFSQNSYCKLCTQRNPSCNQCALQNAIFTCSSCQQNTFFLGFVCIDQCPANYNATNEVCITNNCSQLADCQLCSDVKCISCRALYTLNNNVCEFKVVSAITNLPVPFPFLILTIFTIISAFILKIYFNKMYIPLYLYAFCGLFEAACIALWTVLAIMTSNANLQESVVNIYFTTLLVIIVYVGFNILSFSLSCVTLKKDMKFLGWQRQDNKLGSTVITIISLAISFRFYLIKFSKLGNKQIFSATLQTKQKFSFLTNLSIGSIFIISIPTVILSAFLIYTQQQMNYLFFTCIEMGVISVIMIVLAIMAVLTPSDYLLHKKEDYRKGYDSQQMEGKSMNELLCQVVEEQNFEGQSVGTVGKSDFQGQHFHQFTSQINFGQKITNAEIMTNGKGLLQQKNSEQNEFNQVASNELIKGVEKYLQLEDKQMISEMLQKTLKAKQLILDQMIDEQNFQFIQQVNEEFGNSQSLPSKPVGTIVRQLTNQYEEYESDEDNSDIGQSLDEQQDDNQQDEDMSSSKMLKKKEYQHRNNQLRSHQNLSIDQQIKFMREFQKRHNIQQNIKTVQKIKILAQQLAIKQKQQQFLRQKLESLNNSLSQSDYIKLRQKIQQNNMATQDKLSRLNEMYTRKKIQREKRKSRRISNADTYVLDKEEIQQNLKKQQFKYQPKQGKVQQLNPKKIKINSRSSHNNKKSKRIPQSIEVQTKNKNDYARKNQKSIGKTQHQPQKQKTQRQTKNSVGQVKLKQYQGQQKQKISNKTFKVEKSSLTEQNVEKKVPNLVQVPKKYMNKVRSAAIARNYKKDHNLEPITQEDGKSRDGGFSVYLPIESSSKPKIGQGRHEKQSKNNSNKSEAYMYEPEEEHKSNSSWNQQQIQKTKISPLAFAEPLPQDQPDQIYPIDHQHVVFGQEKVKKNIPKIQYTQGNIESLEEEYNHWPIDPQLEQKILDVQQKANNYVQATKRTKKLNIVSYSSQKIPKNNNQAQSNPAIDDKIFQHSGGRSKYTQLNEPKETLSKDNSIFYNPRESQVEYNYPTQNQLLVFENDEQLRHQLTSGEKLVSDYCLEEDSKINIEIDMKTKIPKRRVNRSVINLSPGKY